eukprot:763466-Hanusia_phi.AAC.3
MCAAGHEPSADLPVANRRPSSVTKREWEPPQDKVFTGIEKGRGWREGGVILPAHTECRRTSEKGLARRWRKEQQGEKERERDNIRADRQ